MDLDDGAPPLGRRTEIGASQADRGALFDRSAHEHHRRLRREPVPFGQRVEDRNVGRTVQDQPEGAVVAVLEEQDDRPVEVGVPDDGRGHEQPALVERHDAHRCTAGRPMGGSPVVRRPETPHEGERPTPTMVAGVGGRPTPTPADQSVPC